MPSKDSYVYNGCGFSILLQPREILLQPKRWRMGATQKIPIRDIRSVIVERKTIMPFATLTVLLIILSIALRYNAFWLLLDPTQTSRMSDLSILAACLSAAPTLSRILFVNVQISSKTNNSWCIRFVSARSGKRLVTAFHDLTGV